MEAVATSLFLVNIIFSFFVYLYLIRKGSAVAFLWLAILMYFSIALVDFTNALQIFEIDTIVSALMFAFFASVVFFFSYIMFYSILSRTISVAPDPVSQMAALDFEHASVWLKWITVPLLLCIPLTLVLVFGTDTFQQTWEERRLVQSKFAIIPVLLAQTLAIFPGVFWLAKNRAWAIVVCLLAIVLSAVIGSRLTAVIALGSLYLGLQFRHGPQHIVRLFPLLALPAAFSLHVFLRLTRGIDAYELVTGLFDGTIYSLLANAARAGVDMFGGERTPFRGFYYVVESEVWRTFPDMFQTIQRIIFVWLPHEISQKPVDVVELLWSRSLYDGYMAYMVSMDAGSDIDKYEALLRLVADGSLHCTLWGEVLANGGYAAAVPVLLFLALLFALQEIGVTALPPVLRFGLMALMIGQFIYVARGSTVTAFTHFLFVGTIWCLLIVALTYPWRGHVRALP